MDQEEGQSTNGGIAGERLVLVMLTCWKVPRLGGDGLGVEQEEVTTPKAADEVGHRGPRSESKRATWPPLGTGLRPDAVPGEDATVGGELEAVSHDRLEVGTDGMRLRTTTTTLIFRGTL
jgi:hypothetical protein